MRLDTVVGVIALATLSAALLGCHTGREPKAPQPGRKHVKLLSYNVNYGLAGDAESVAVIGAADADVVLLQETSERWEAVLRDQLAPRYPHMSFRHCCLAGGLAVLSKYAFEDGDYLPTEHGWFPAWRVVVDSPIGPLQLLNVHLRPQISDSGSVVSGYFTTPAVRQAEIREHFPTLDPNLPTVVMGDFNEGSSGRAVVYLEQRGFKSALTQFAGEQDTWRWSTSVGEVRTQLDHMVYDPRLEPLDVYVVQGGRSDHLPVMGIFQLNEAVTNH
jgi:endonuclease/exonuclease/phosphatase (EEP) superfamily protein YafD